MRELQIMVKAYRGIQELTGKALLPHCQPFLHGDSRVHLVYSLMVGGRMTTLHEFSDPTVPGLLIVFLWDEKDRRKPVLFLHQGLNTIVLQEQVLFDKTTTRTYAWFTPEGGAVSSSGKFR